MPSTNLTQDDLDCINHAETNMKQALQMIEEGEWKTLKTVEEDVVKMLKTPFGTAFCVMGTVNLSPSEVFHEVVYNCEDVSWNPALKSLKRVHCIGDSTDVVYCVSKELAGGVIACRDFIYARTWVQKDNSYFMGWSSVSKFNPPLIEGLVRGEHGPSVYICQPIPDNPSSSKIQYSVIASMKGWIPQYVVDQAMPTVLLDYMVALRKLGEERKFKIADLCTKNTSECDTRTNLNDLKELS